MIEVGSRAPDFTLPRQNGTLVHLADLRGHPVIVYFYPKAGTPGCTRETEGFVERYSELRGRGVELLGVSVDSVERQERFASECSVPFPLLSDSGREVARAYGVLGILGIAKRVTFILDPDGTVIDVIAGMMPGPHVRGVVDRYLGAPP